MKNDVNQEKTISTPVQKRDISAFTGAEVGKCFNKV
jgi:hypothetical protein